MSKLDVLCAILLEEQDLLADGKTLPKRKLNKFNRLWIELGGEHEN